LALNVAFEVAGQIDAIHPPEAFSNPTDPLGVERYARCATFPANGAPVDEALTRIEDINATYAQYKKTHKIPEVGGVWEDQRVDEFEVNEILHLRVWPNAFKGRSDNVSHLRTGIATGAMTSALVMHLKKARGLLFCRFPVVVTGDYVMQGLIILSELPVCDYLGNVCEYTEQAGLGMVSTFFTKDLEPLLNYELVQKAKANLTHVYWTVMVGGTFMNLTGSSWWLSALALARGYSPTVLYSGGRGEALDPALLPFKVDVALDAGTKLVLTIDIDSVPDILAENTCTLSEAVAKPSLGCVVIAVQRTEIAFIGMYAYLLFAGGVERRVRQEEAPQAPKNYEGNEEAKAWARWANNEGEAPEPQLIQTLTEMKSNMTEIKSAIARAGRPAYQEVKDKNGQVSQRLSRPADYAAIEKKMGNLRTNAHQFEERKNRKPAVTTSQFAPRKAKATSVKARLPARVRQAIIVAEPVEIPAEDEV